MLMHRFGCLDHVYRVGGTIFLIAFLVYVPQIFIVWPWYGREISTDLLKLLVPFKRVLPCIVGRHRNDKLTSSSSFSYRLGMIASWRECFSGTITSA
jgi:hypothetical protein